MKCSRWRKGNLKSFGVFHLDIFSLHFVIHWVRFHLSLKWFKSLQKHSLLCHFSKSKIFWSVICKCQKVLPKSIEQSVIVKKAKKAVLGALFSKAVWPCPYCEVNLNVSKLTIRSCREDFSKKLAIFVTSKNLIIQSKYF